MRSIMYTRISRKKFSRRKIIVRVSSKDFPLALLNDFYSKIKHINSSAIFARKVKYVENKLWLVLIYFKLD